MPLSRAEIQYAVKCPVWQEFRKSLKDLSTQRKLNWLLEWLKPMDWQQARATDEMTKKIAEHKGENTTDNVCCDLNRRQVQVLNYLTALSRGGQIEPVPQRWQYKDQVQAFLQSRAYRIRK